MSIEHGRQTARPCVVHLYHSPHTIVNEEHHVFPQWMQKLVPNPLQIPTSDADELTVVCATGHNNIHWGMDQYIASERWPANIRDGEREYAIKGVAAFIRNGGDLDVARAHLHGQGE